MTVKELYNWLSELSDSGDEEVFIMTEYESDSVKRVQIETPLTDCAKARKRIVLIGNEFDK